MRYSVRKVLPTGILVLVILLGSIGGAVAYGRNSLDRQVSYALSERWETFKEGLVTSETASELARFSAWNRLCYVPSQIAAYDFYNVGNGGKDFSLIPWLFVPRFVAPEKPVITQTNIDFTIKINGNQYSSTGMGIFFSGYYDAGWFGVLIVSVICGWILAQTSAMAMAILRRNALLLLPFALAGVYMAFRIDGQAVAEYIGPFIILLFIFVLPSLLVTYKEEKL